MQPLEMRNPPNAPGGLRDADHWETDHREAKPVSPAVQARWLGEVSCHFEDAYRSAVKGVLRLGEAGLGPTDEVAGVIAELGDIAVGMTRLADQIGAALAGQLGTPVK